MDGSDVAVELVIGGYLLASATLLIIGARLGDHWGHKTVDIAGLVLFTIASLACGIASEPGFLIGARVARGLGGALAFPQMLTSFQLYLDGTHQRHALGLYPVALAGGGDR